MVTMKSLYKYVAILVLVLALAVPVSAQSGDKPGKAGGEVSQDDKITPGLISSTGHYRGQTAVPLSVETEAAGGKPGPIMGSIARVNSKECEAVLKNGSKDTTYSVQYKVIGKTSRGRTALQRNFSSVIKPASSTSKRITNCQKGLNLELIIISGKSVGKKKSSKTVK